MHSGGTLYTYSQLYTSQIWIYSINSNVMSAMYSDCEHSGNLHVASTAVNRQYQLLIYIIWRSHPPVQKPQSRMVEALGQRLGFLEIHATMYVMCISLSL